MDETPVRWLHIPQVGLEIFQQLQYWLNNYWDFSSVIGSVNTALCRCGIFSATKNIQGLSYFFNSPIALQQKLVYYFIFTLCCHCSSVLKCVTAISFWQKETRRTRHYEKFNPPPPQSHQGLRFPRLNSLTLERTTIWDRLVWRKKKTCTIVRCSALPSVDSKVTSTPPLSFKSPISFVFDKRGS